MFQILSRDGRKEGKLPELLNMSFMSWTCFPSGMWHHWEINGKIPELWELFEKKPQEPSQIRLESLWEELFLGGKMWLIVGWGCEGMQEKGKCGDADYILWYFWETGLVYNLHNPIKCRLKGPQKLPRVYPHTPSWQAGKCWQTGVGSCGVVV